MSLDGPDVMDGGSSPPQAVVSKFPVKKKEDCYAIFFPNHYSINSTEDSPKKLKDPGKFAITIGLGNHRFKALCDLGASASLLPLSIYEKLDMGKLSPVKMKIFMADGSWRIFLFKWASSSSRMTS